ncbi:MAG: DUF4123 domain-containing protein [Pseudomonadota bacterium]|nr:DUF4123 domain-containing protein [Pseudomonadota bacterium]
MHVDLQADYLVHQESLLYQQQLQILDDWLIQEDQHSVIVMIDPEVTDSMAQLSKGLEDQKIALRPIHPSLTTQPYLLQLSCDQHQRDVLNQSLLWGLTEALADRGDIAVARSIGFWLGGGEARLTASYVHQLKRLGQVIRPDGEQHFLRYWDPRVLPILSLILDDQQYQLLYQMLYPCLYMDWYGQLQTLSLPKRTTALSAQFMRQKFKFTTQQWQQLEQIEWINDTIRLIKAWHQSPAEILIPQLYSCQQRCLAYGFSAPMDATLFVSLASRYHWRFDQHPLVNRRLQPPHAAKTLGQALQKITSDDWQQIRQDLASHSG